MAEVRAAAGAEAGWSSCRSDRGLWSRVFSVAPLVLVGTKERDGTTSLRSTWRCRSAGRASTASSAAPTRDLQERGAHPEFTVSFPRPEQIVESSFAAGGRFAGGEKPALAAVPAAPARVVDVPVVEGCSLYIECELERIVDGFGAEQPDRRPRRGRRRGAETRCAAPRCDDADLVYRLGLLAYLAPGRFAVVRDSTVVPVPGRLPAVARWRPRPHGGWSALAARARPGDGRAARATRAGRVAVARSADAARAVFDPRRRARPARLPGAAGPRRRRRRRTSTRGRRQRRRGEPRQLLIGHMDTVWPVGTLAEMPRARRRTGCCSARARPT